MEKSSTLIRKSKKKFLIFSLIGLVLILAITQISYKLHNHIMERQQKVIELYMDLGNQLLLVNQIASLSEFYQEDTPLDKETYRKVNAKFKQYIREIQKENKDLQNWLEKNDYFKPHFTDTLLEGVAEKGEAKRPADRSKDYNYALHLYIKRAKTLVDGKYESAKESRETIDFLSNEGRFALIEVFKYFKQRAEHVRIDTVNKIKHLGFLLILFTMSQVVLAWVLVFRPLYKTILHQNDSLNNAYVKAQSANRSKTDFLANISHEIRTPMTAISGYSELLKDENSTNEQKKSFVSIIDRNLKHLISLIDEILEISKIEAGKLDIQMRDTNLSKALNEVYLLLKVKAEDKNISLTMENSSNFPNTIKTDPTKLKQILFNVIGNAIKFTEQGEVKVNLSFSHFTNNLVLTIKDTGCGIPQQYLKHLFKPFSQVDSSSSRQFDGSGLGLALSKGIAKGLNGDIKIIESRIGVGTTFEVSLLLEDKEFSNFTDRIIPSQLEENLIAKSLKGNKLENSKILVVDDAKENAVLFKIYLNKAGAEVTICNDGFSAIETAKNSDFDIILLDLQMPEKDGYQVIKELRQNGFLKPIVALTAHAMKEEKVKTSNAGFNGHITKPVKPNAFIDQVFQLMAKRRHAHTQTH